MHTTHMSDCSPVPHWCTRQLLWSAAIIALMHDQRNAEWQPQWMRWRRRRRRLWTAAYGTTNWLMRWLSFVSFRFDSFAIEIGQMRAPIDDALPLCCIGNNCERWYGNFTIDGEREREGAREDIERKGKRTTNCALLRKLNLLWVRIICNRSLWSNTSAKSYNRPDNNTTETTTTAKKKIESNKPRRTPPIKHVELCMPHK